MSKPLKPAVVPSLAAVLLACMNVSHAAASIAGDAFNLSIAYDGPTTASAGPFTGTASATLPADSLYDAANADVAGEFQEGAATLLVRARWIDADTIWFFLQGDATQFTNLSFTASGLDFTSNGQPTEIVGAKFNLHGGPPGSGFDDFDAVTNGSVSPPAVSFTEHSVTMTFGTFTGPLTADGPTMEVDVQAKAIPEPAAGALLLAGLGALGLVRRRGAGG